MLVHLVVCRLLLVRVLTGAAVHEVVATAAPPVVNVSLSGTLTITLSTVLLRLRDTLLDQDVFIDLFVHGLQVFVEALVHMRVLVASSVAAHGVTAGHRVVGRLPGVAVGVSGRYV